MTTITHNTQEQDLRTALDELSKRATQGQWSLGASEDGYRYVDGAGILPKPGPDQNMKWTGFARFVVEMEDGMPCVGEDNVRFVIALVNAYRSGALTAPPRPDHAGGVDAHWTCAARGVNGANDPQDCDWPMCGCDPHADKVIAALQECGYLASPAQAPDKAAKREGVKTQSGYSIREVLHAAEGRLALLMKADLPESDHPVATGHVLRWVQEALAALTPSAPIAAPVRDAVQIAKTLMADWEANKKGSLPKEYEYGYEAALAHVIYRAEQAAPVRDDGARGEAFASLISAAATLGSAPSEAAYGRLSAALDRLRASNSAPAPAGDVPGEAQTSPDSTAQGDAQTEGGL